MESRSSNFDYFKPSQGSKKQKNKKEAWKKAWLVIKIILYVLLFAFTLTGCVQSIAVKSSSFSGAGTEFYSSQEKISPVVATFKQGTKKKDDKYLKDNQYYKVEHIPEANFHLSYKKYKSTLEDLRNQAKNVGAEYGQRGSFTSSVQYIKNNGDFVNGQPIFKGETGQYLFTLDKAKEYKSVFNNWTQDIKFIDPQFDIKKLYDEKTKDKDGNYTLDPKQLKITFPDKENVVLKKASLFSLYSTRSGYANRNNAIYARDIFELLYRETFLKEDNYYKQYLKVHNKASYEEVLNEIVEGKKTKITDEERNFLINYQDTINNYLLITNLNTTTSKAPQLDENGIQTFDKNGNIQLTNLDQENSIYGGPSTSIGSQIAFAAAEPQIPFPSFESTLGYGPFFSFAVWPLSAFVIATRAPLGDAGGWSTILVIFLAVIIVRAIGLAITWKATMSQTIQEELRAKKAKIDAKYADVPKSNKELKMRQQQEIAELYKKNGVSPMDSLISIIISLPIFIAMWRVIQSVPELKSTTWLGIDFAAVSYRRLFAGEWQYFFILLFAGSSQILTMIIPRILNKRSTKRLTIEQKQALKKSDRMQWIMMFVFLFITFVFSAGVQIYWIISNIWSISQSLGIHYFKKSNFYKKRYAKKVVS